MDFRTTTWPNQAFGPHQDWSESISPNARLPGPGRFGYPGPSKRTAILALKNRPKRAPNWKGTIVFQRNPFFRGKMAVSFREGRFWGRFWEPLQPNDRHVQVLGCLTPLKRFLQGIFFNTQGVKKTFAFKVVSYLDPFFFWKTHLCSWPNYEILSKPEWNFGKDLARWIPLPFSHRPLLGWPRVAILCLVRRFFFTPRYNSHPESPLAHARGVGSGDDL